MSGVSFAHPWALGVLALVPVILGAWWWGLARGRRQLRQFARQTAPGTGYVTALLVSLAVALAIVAASQPRWGTRESAIPREGSELVVVLDVSRSMGATDVEPSRLAAAKTAITTTLERLGGDRVGLVIFAGNARVRFPLTTDFLAATQVISALETGSVIVEGGSSASQGLDLALSVFDPDAGAGKLILLISDGDDLGEDPGGAAQRVRDAGVDLLVAGAGSGEGTTVPVLDGRTGTIGPKVGVDGQPIVSRLNETFLRALATGAGGRYLGSDLGVVPGAVDGRLSALDRARFAEETAELPIERFQPFAIAALALLLLGTLLERMPLPSRRRAVMLAGATLAMLLLSGCATRGHDLNEQARDAYDRGDYERAIELFTEAQAEEPDNFRVTLNLATALHAAGRFDEAALAARRALVSPSTDVRNRAQALLGHHRFALGDLEGSLDAFKAALLEDPQDEASRHDYEVVLRLLRPADPAEDPGQGDDVTPTPSATQEGEGGEGEGEQSPEPGASGTPEPGSQPGPPGQGPTQPGATPGQQAPGQQGGEPGRPDSVFEVDQLLDQIDDEIAVLTEGAEEPTAAEALRILQLLAERERISAIRDALAGGGDPNDY
ncbi:MAG: VWA domain-containing protein [Dehalococcoidia bacterium]|nr:VWA domain-containing protein [Dehalococcoidia bacterium]